MPKTSINTEVAEIYGATQNGRWSLQTTPSFTSGRIAHPMRTRSHPVFHSAKDYFNSALAYLQALDRNALERECMDLKEKIKKEDIRKVFALSWCSSGHMKKDKIGVSIHLNPKRAINYVLNRLNERYNVDHRAKLRKERPGVAYVKRGMYDRLKTFNEKSMMLSLDYARELSESGAILFPSPKLEQLL